MNKKVCSHCVRGLEAGDAINVTLERNHLEYEVSKKSNALSNFYPTHLGEILQEDVLPSLKLTVTGAAKELGIARQNLRCALAGEMTMTPEMALNRRR